MAYQLSTTLPKTQCGLKRTIVNYLELTRGRSPVLPTVYFPVASEWSAIRELGSGDAPPSAVLERKESASCPRTKVCPGPRTCTVAGLPPVYSS